jgi:hypothetical protein
MPAVRAGLQVERNDRVGEQVLAAAFTAVDGAPAAARVAEGPIHEAEFRVDGRVHPRRGAAVLPTVA